VGTAVTASDDLLALVEAELAQPVSPGARALAERIRARHGAAVRAVLFYGSCLRRGDDQEGVLDLYVLVEDYRSAYASWAHAAMNRLLPPNVFYLEARVGDRLVRGKYAVLACRDLTRLTSARTFEPYFWARFAQPCAFIYAADEQVRREVAAALSAAILTTVGCGVPLVAPRFSSRELWTTTWSETYRAEVRAERPGAAEALWASAPDRYERLTRLALPALPYPTVADETSDPILFTVDLPHAAPRRARRVWRVRRVYGKAMFLLRILRNALIFEDGVDYVLWKIQRHSGVEVDHRWRERRHPLLALGAEAWRLYRSGAFR